MDDRIALAKSFLNQTSWANVRRAPLAGDASNRRYERLLDPDTGKTAVLMDASPDRGEDVRPFVRIARHLRTLGLSAPNILAKDVANGFLLIEDLGDALFARAIPENPELETDFYTAATDVLLALHQAPVPDLKPYDPDLMADLAALAFGKYRRGIAGNTEGEDEFRELFRHILSGISPFNPVLIQRDYHAENLLWLPERHDVARVGLLDFQDAMSGHPAYDLVSLLQDARRDVPERIEQEMIGYYLDQSGIDQVAFRSAYAVLGAQRNLRILGVFARLGQEYGKPHYIDLIPRVWSHLMRDLDHPSLASVAPMLKQYLPVPSAANLQRLKTP